MVSRRRHYICEKIRIKKVNNVLVLLRKLFWLHRPLNRVSGIRSHPQIMLWEPLAQNILTYRKQGSCPRLPESYQRESGANEGLPQSKEETILVSIRIHAVDWNANIFKFMNSYESYFSLSPSTHYLCLCFYFSVSICFNGYLWRILLINWLMEPTNNFENW